MTKKKYIYLFLICSFLIFLLLPLFNYSIDRWRVLHSDYNHYYAYQESPNKTFLKTKYLSEHPEKGKSILMGSSNGGYINANLIEPGTYNMKYNFGLLAIHLQNIKTMIKMGVPIKTLWIGINDYIIWKDPKDYENSFERSLYRADFREDMKTYLHYLFRKPDVLDWYLFVEHYVLRETDIISNPQPHLEAKRREEKHLKTPTKWRAEIDAREPTLLHYDDTHYRIESALREISELKELAKKHHIKLVIFTYPTFFKSYLLYNQFAIEEFKRKLSNIMPYYDFYELNRDAFDGLKWQDTMHFSYSYGNYLIYSIKSGKNLVTKENIEKHITSTYKIAKKSLLEYFNDHRKILPVHENILKKLTLVKNKKIYELKKSFYLLQANRNFEILQKKDTIEVKLKTKVSTINLPKLNTKKSIVVGHFNITSSHTTLFRIYYKKSANGNYTERATFRKTLKRGKNNFNLFIPAEYIKWGLRVDFANTPGAYLVNKFEIIE